MFQFTTTTVINNNVEGDGVRFSGKSGVLNVKRHNKFKKENVVAVYKRVASDPEMAEVTLDLNSLEAGFYRIALYIRLSGNNNSYYQPSRMNTIPSMNQQQPQFVGLKGRPVSSLEEARAAAIDFDGSVFFFPDLANKRIYTKQINLDGTASMNMYEYKEVPTEAFNSSNFVTRQEFDETLNDIKGALNMIAQQTQQQPKVEEQPKQQINF